MGVLLMKLDSGYLCVCVCVLAAGVSAVQLALCKWCDPLMRQLCKSAAAEA